MDVPGKNLVAKRVIVYEKIAFAFIILLIWLDEAIDIPDFLLGAETTPLNWRESLFESICIAILAAVIIRFIKKNVSKNEIFRGNTVIMRFLQKN